MNLTPTLADKIAKRYNREVHWNGRTDLGEAFREMIRRDGLAILTDDARRELILMLGETRRSGNALRLWRLSGGDTTRGWYAAWRASLNNAFRRAEQAPALKQAAE